MKFIADNMLGKLAKYLRFMGYDTYYTNRYMSDDDIINIANKDERILITRDKELATRYKNSILIESTDSIDQLRQVIRAFGLNDEKMLTRCSICNVILIKTSKEDVKGKVPENVYKNFNDFFVCPSCGRYYWYGTHARNIEETVKAVEKNENSRY
ncbi:MAG: Mut7-C RNAse domain-containing protein [Thermoplasmata archaeon]